MITTDQLTLVFLNALKGYATEVHAFRSFTSNDLYVYDQSGNLILSIPQVSILRISRNADMFAEIIYPKVEEYKCSHDLWRGDLKVCL